MQNKGVVKFFAIIFAIVCIFQLSFTVVSYRYSVKADAYAHTPEVMEEATFVRDDSGLVRAFAFIHKHQLIDLPVVDREGKLVGLASRVDIGRALLTTWCQDAPDTLS